MTERESQLLSAYLDGELSPAELVRAEELLGRSEEARQFVAQLRQQKQLLSNLPVVPPPHDVAAVLARQLRKKRKRILELQRVESRRWWLRVAAAAILLASGIGATAWMLSGRGLHDGERPIVQATDPIHQHGGDRSLAELAETHGRDQLALAVRQQTQAVQAAALGAWQVLRDQAVRADEAQMIAGSWLDGWSRPWTGELDRMRRLAETDVLTSPMRVPTQPFKTVDIQLPWIVDLVGADAERLSNRLDAPQLHQLDLAFPDVVKGLERLATAAQTAGVTLTLDAEVQAMVQKKRPAAALVVYLENLTPEQVGKFLAAWHAGETGVTDDSGCKSLIHFALDRIQVGRLAQLLGVPASTLRVEDRQGSLPAVDLSRPLSEDTLRHLRHLAEGPGLGFRRPPGPPAVAVMARSQQPNSKEVRAILEGRTGPRRGAVSLIVVLRPTR
ncbi:MAG TPA: hypothetical protein PKD86_04495 [Gemmatales bacterium]|nr:hypothetical protein [Gemmatales bacterium]HMP58592.1 hypothetical protein [Gemmatales bacterium]